MQLDLCPPLAKDATWTLRSAFFEGFRSEEYITYEICSGYGIESNDLRDRVNEREERRNGISGFIHLKFIYRTLGKKKS